VIIPKEITTVMHEADNEAYDIGPGAVFIHYPKGNHLLSECLEHEGTRSNSGDCDYDLHLHQGKTVRMNRNITI